MMLALTLGTLAFFGAVFIGSAIWTWTGDLLALRRSGGPKGPRASRPVLRLEGGGPPWAISPAYSGLTRHAPPLLGAAGYPLPPSAGAALEASTGTRPARYFGPHGRLASPAR